jgi:16S rRNA (guanine527-N7)-methyltransferase
MAWSPSHSPEDQLAAGAERLGVDLSPDQLAALSFYVTEILRWSGKMSLTALETPDALTREGILDSLACARHVPPEPVRVVDIGSGAGFPAIPLALIRGAARFTLIESVRKKVTFLRHILRTLHLSNAEVWHGRAEQFAEDPARLAFDLAFARAAAPMRVQSALAYPLLRPGGTFLAQTTRQAAAAELDHIHRSQFELRERVEVPDWIAGADREVCVLHRR